MNFAVVMNYVVHLIVPIIFVFAVINIFVLRKTKQAIKALQEINHPTSNIRAGTQANVNIPDCIDALMNHSKSAAKKYTWYTNITAIFPLLGILGTVVSLMNLSGTDDISANFASALGTTFWGLIFAIAFKLADSSISAELDRALDDADYLIRQHDEEMRQQYAPQAETGYRN